MNEWMNVFMRSTQTALEELLTFLPKILVAAVIIVVGWIIAKIIQKVALKLFEIIGINKLAQKAGVESFLQASGVKRTVAWIFARILFWTVFLVFLLPISDILGLVFFGDLVNRMLSYMPDLAGALLIILVGSWAAKVFSGIVRGSSVRLGSEYAEVMGTVAHSLLLAVVFILALSQLHLDSTLLSSIMLIALGAIALALAASFAVGSMGIIKNIIAGIYVNRYFSSGSQIKTIDFEGTVAEIGPIFTVIDTPDKKRVSIPNNALLVSQ
jgi:small-conductance mechanosensitive channel